MAKIVKRRGSQLEVRVRKTRPREVVGHAKRIATHPTPFAYPSSLTLENAMWIHLQLLSELNTKQLQTRLFVSINAASLQDSITAQIMSMGESKYKGGKKVKRKISKGLHVDLTWIKTFLGDRDSVHQLFEEEMEEYGMEPSDKGVHFVL
ncbi:hypothetical protein POM88_003708 [Heracleum sosnowskyi]|uniref:Uncharacterized protein n=1 Tax=Heracleum sosnowskyi TaxID=360622 RepID=A0AAD8NDT0_9APIA|nr:hypothetical protein POM88_003708 [Heracleum sosnowskyi]